MSDGNNQDDSLSSTATCTAIVLREQDLPKEDKNCPEKEELPNHLWPWFKAVNDVLSNRSPPSSDLPLEVTPWLYLSNESTILCHAERLRRELGITHVLSTNAMDDVDDEEELIDTLQKAGINHHLMIAGQDDEQYDMIGNHWKDCRLFLEKVRQQQKEGQRAAKVVVHCSAGVNRSGLMVVAALVVLEEMPLLQAVQHLKKLRGTVLINVNFQKQLCQLADQAGRLGEKPVGYTAEPIEGKMPCFSWTPR